MQRPTVGVVDYQAGNVRSVANAFEHAGAHVVTVAAPGDFTGLSHVVLPGVGAFGYCADRLRGSGLLPTLEQWALADARPLLGICVGMQLFADISEEMGEQSGLGWGGGAVRRLHGDAPTVRVPHVGWNTVRFDEPFGDFEAGTTSDFYFDHSFAYQAPTRARRIGACTHGDTFCAVIRRDNLVAAQFHPEKSQTAGLRFLAGFLALRS